jgi:hypothetical protein
MVTTTLLSADRLSLLMVGGPLSGEINQCIALRVQPPLAGHLTMAVYLYDARSLS